MSTQQTRKRYTYAQTHSERGTFWRIFDTEVEGVDDDSIFGALIFEWPVNEESDGDLYPPAHVRAEYERLIEYIPGETLDASINIVELLASNEESSGYLPPCRHGHLVDNHAVYCHSPTWLYAPSKCRRTWYTGGMVRDEDCEGYCPRTATRTATK